MTAPPVRRLDRGALLGLAHPLRVRLYDLLVTEGAATASALGRRLGESSGATSYHLRQLERHGFVETDPERGNGRERWWRAVREVVQTRGRDFDDDPADAEAHRLVSDELLRNRRARQDSWRASWRQWPEEWRDASGESTSHLRLDAAELAELNGQLTALVMAWAERAEGRDGDPRYLPVELQSAVFPSCPPPFDGAVSTTPGDGDS